MIIPPANVEIEEIKIKGKLILFYHINPDKEKVFCRKDNEKVYLRI
jgi:ATP-dependent DNA helicase RecG